MQLGHVVVGTGMRLFIVNSSWRSTRSPYRALTVLTIDHLLPTRLAGALATMLNSAPRANSTSSRPCT